MKRKRLNVFSLSFLDIITCGLGAIILLFVLVNAKGAARRDTVTADLRAEVTRFEKEVLESKKQLILARNTLEKTVVELAETQGLSRQVIDAIKEEKIELADRDMQRWWYRILYFARTISRPGARSSTISRAPSSTSSSRLASITGVPVRSS